MKTLSLVLRIVAILAAVASTALFFLAKGKLAEKESQLTATQQTLQSTEGNLATAKASITALENKLAAESQALANTKNQLASVRSEAYTSRQELSRTRQQLGQTRTRIVELEENAKELKNELAMAERRANEVVNSTGEKDELLARIEELESSKENLQNELELAKSRPADSATPRGQSGSGSQVAGGVSSQNPAVLTRLSVETKIQSVSSKNGLIVLHADPSLGLAPGQKLRLIHDLRNLGSVEVSVVENSLALANVLPGTNVASLDAGSEIQLFR